MGHFTRSYDAYYTMKWVKLHAHMMQVTTLVHVDIQGRLTKSNKLLDVQWIATRMNSGLISIDNE